MPDAWQLQRGSSGAIGPFSTEEILEGLESGEIPPDAKVCPVDGKLWSPIESTPQFVRTARAPRVERAAPAPRRERARPRARTVHPAPAVVAGSAAAILGASAVVLACVPGAALGRLFDVTRPLRASVAMLGGLAVVFGVSAAIGARRVGRDDASLARAAFLPACAVALAALFIRLPSDLATTAELTRARIILVCLIGAVIVSAFVHAAALSRALLTRRRALPIAALSVTAACMAVGWAASTAAHLRDVVVVPGSAPVPLFTDDAAAAGFAEAVHAGASGTSALDAAFARAVFVEPNVRIRVLAEERRPLGAAAQRTIVQRVTVLDGPHRGESLLRVVR